MEFMKGLDFPWKKQVLYAAGTAAVLAAMALLWPESLLARLAIAFVVLHAAWMLGRALEPRSIPTAFGLGLISVLAVQSVIQTVLYYAGARLGIVTDLVSLALSVVVLHIALPFVAPRETGDADEPEASDTPSRVRIGLALAAGIIAFLACVRFAIAASTTEAVRTPWPLLSPGFFLGIGMIPLAAAAAFFQKNGRKTGILLSLLSILAVTLIAPLVYSLGYGFDGFLHHASQRILFETGTLEPKPLYYIGQYMFVTWLSRLSELSLASIDRFLVPIAASTLVLAASVAWRRNSWALLGIPLLLPLAPFVATTPQSFSYVLGIFAVFFALGSRDLRSAALPAAACALWSLATHPLAGLPFVGATMVALLSSVWNPQRRWTRWAKTTTLGVLIIGSAVSVPAAFYANDVLAGRSQNWNIQAEEVRGAITGAWQGIMIPANHVALWADWGAFAEYALPLLLVLFAALAIWKKEERRETWIACSILALGIWLAGLALRTVGDFSFLIDYERGNYADRMFLISELVLLFPALAGFSSVAERIWKGSPLARTAFLLLLFAWMGGHAYAALPRHDAAAASRGWSIGLADYEAVRLIEQDAGGTPYTVLANQSVSAAAVDTYGFRRYVKDASSGEEIFYYPLPTGGALYRLYLEAVAPEPSFEAIREAARLGQTETVYVVLNRYWWDAERVAETLKERAQKTITAGDGRVRIYRFDVSN